MFPVLKVHYSFGTVSWNSSLYWFHPSLVCCPTTHRAWGYASTSGHAPTVQLVATWLMTSSLSLFIGSSTRSLWPIARRRDDVTSNPTRIVWMGRGATAHTLETAGQRAVIGSRARGEGLLLREKRGRVENIVSEKVNSVRRTRIPYSRA